MMENLKTVKGVGHLMVIIVALMRKPMHVFFGILKKNQQFNGDLVK